MSVFRSIRGAVAASLALAALTFAPLADAANDVFLQMEGMQGDATDATFRDAIVVQDFAFGVSTGPTTVGALPGKPQFDVVTFSKRVDRSSPKLFAAAAAAQGIPTATFSTRGTGVKAFVFYKIKLTDVLVSSLKVSETADLMESVSLSFGKIEIEVFTQDPQGRVTSAGKAGWDVRSSRRL